jgi:hypothetical protein
MEPENAEHDSPSLAHISNSSSQDLGELFPERALDAEIELTESEKLEYEVTS